MKDGELYVKPPRRPGAPQLAAQRRCIQPLLGGAWYFELWRNLSGEPRSNRALHFHFPRILAADHARRLGRRATSSELEPRSKARRGRGLKDNIHTPTTSNATYGSRTHTSGMQHRTTTSTPRSAGTSPGDPRWT